MKIRRCYLLLLGFWLSLASGMLAAAEPEKRTLTIFHPPVSNVSVKLSLFFEIFDLLEKDLPVTFQMTDLPWKRAIQKAEDGAGGIIPFSKNADRLKHFDFSDEIFRDEIVLVVLKEKTFPFRGIDDLKGKTIGYLGGASVGEEFERGLRDVFKGEPDFAGPETRLRKLLAGRIDAAVVSTGVPGLNSIIALDSELMRNRDRFIILPTPLASDPNYLAFAKTMQMQDFLREFNRALAAARNDGRLQKILNSQTRLRRQNPS